MADATLETRTELVSADETCRELTSQYSESRRREMCALACPNCGSTDLQWVFKHSRPKFKFGSLVCLVKDGRIQFLSDYTHELAGQTIEIPDWDNA